MVGWPRTTVAVREEHSGDGLLMAGRVSRRQEVHALRLV